jgi:hypothetical protein
VRKKIDGIRINWIKQRKRKRKGKGNKSRSNCFYRVKGKCVKNYERNKRWSYKGLSYKGETLIDLWWYSYKIIRLSNWKWNKVFWVEKEIIQKSAGSFRAI